MIKRASVGIVQPTHVDSDLQCLSSRVSGAAVLLLLRSIYRSYI